jgi:uncharacterized membrane-anchored protein
MTEAPRSFNPGRWSVRGLVFGTAILSAALIAYLVAWGDPVNDLHMTALDLARGVIYADLAAFVTGSLGEAAAAIFGVRK